MAKVVNGVVTEYPISEDTYKANVGLVQVVLPERKIVDAYTYIPSNPTLVNGQWVITWVKDENTPADIIALRTKNAEINVRYNRDMLMNEAEFRVSRYNRLSRLGKPQIDDIAKLDQYMQDLADVPTQPGFPFVIQWPTKP